MDQQGSVRQHLAADGSVLPGSSYAYTPFGVVASGNTPAPFGFTGELHSEGLVYLRARWYDPSVGAFTSRDPFAGFPETPYSLHPYQYGYSAPTMWTDPSGRCTLPNGEPCPPLTTGEPQTTPTPTVEPTSSHRHPEFRPRPIQPTEEPFYDPYGNQGITSSDLASVDIVGDLSLAANNIIEWYYATGDCSCKVDGSAFPWGPLSDWFTIAGGLDVPVNGALVTSEVTTSAPLWWVNASEWTEVSRTEGPLQDMLQRMPPTLGSSATSSRQVTGSWWKRTFTRYNFTKYVNHGAAASGLVTSAGVEMVLQGGQDQFSPDCYSPNERVQRALVAGAAGLAAAGFGTATTIGIVAIGGPVTLAAGAGIGISIIASRVIGSDGGIKERALISVSGRP